MLCTGFLSTSSLATNANSTSHVELTDKESTRPEYIHWPVDNFASSASNDEYFMQTILQQVPAGVYLTYSARIINSLY